LISGLSKNLVRLELEFADSSPEKRKFIKDEAYEEFAVSFKNLGKLKVLVLNLNHWGSF
jgi:hypothetical protein